MKKPARGRLIITVAALASLFLPAAATASPTIDSACPLGYFCSTTYFNNAAHDTVVGRSTTNCVGNTTSSGVRSAYIDYSRSICTIV